MSKSASALRTRIVFVIQTPEFGGAEKHLLDFVTRIQAPVECVILALSEDFYSSRLQGQPNVTVLRGASSQKRSLFSLWKQLAGIRPNVVVLVKGIFDHYRLGVYVVARLCGARRLVVIEHLMPDAIPEVSDGGLQGWIRRRLGWRARYLFARRLQARATSVTVCVSDAIRRRLIEEYRYPEHNTMTIRNGIDTHYYGAEASVQAIFPPCSAKEPMPVTIICAARLSPVKRIDLLIDALAMLRESHQHWRCLILGTGPLKECLLQQVVRLSLQDCVSFVGHVTDVRPYLKQSDIFVLPSDKEGLSLALLEAMAAGLPAVATDVGGAGEVIVNGENGILVKPGSMVDLERALSYLVVHHEHRRQMGTNARSHVLKYFDINVSMNKLEQVVCHP